MEGSCSGAAEGLEIRTASPLLSSSGHSGRLALSSGQRSLPASVYHCGTTPSDQQRLPLQAEVSLSMTNCLIKRAFLHSERSSRKNACKMASKCSEYYFKELLKLTRLNFVHSSGSVFACCYLWAGLGCCIMQQPNQNQLHNQLSCSERE